MAPTCELYSTECALVSSHRFLSSLATMKPVLVVEYCRFRCQGSEKLGWQCTQYTFTTASMNLACRNNHNTSLGSRQTVHRSSSPLPAHRRWYMPCNQAGGSAKSYRLVVFHRSLILNEVPGQQVLAYQLCHCSMQGRRSEGRSIAKDRGMLRALPAACSPNSDRVPFIESMLTTPVLIFKVVSLENWSPQGWTLDFS